MTNCPNCGAPYNIDKPVCEYCGTLREGYIDPRPPERFFMGRDVRTGELRYMRIDPSQQTACGVQALANAASHNTCSFEQMRLDVMQARFTAAEREQTARLMQNAFPPVEQPVMEPERKKRTPAAPLLFYSSVFWLAVLTVLTAVSVYCCASHGAGVPAMATLTAIISAGYAVDLRALKRGYEWEEKR